MDFVSTVSTGSETMDPISFEQAVFQGLAPDGGLYEPKEMPDLSGVISSFNETTSFNEIAAQITSNLFPEELSLQEAQLIADRAFNFAPRLKWDRGNAILELYHGPSYAFKDFGASFLATLMSHFLGKESKRAIILTATSGDTGSAVANAFYKQANIDVVVLYPSKCISRRQESQMTTLGENIHALEVQGNFDDCQSLVKQAFLSKELASLPLTSANSINIGRLIPQSFYYIYAYAQINLSKKLYFVVPSGNLGNLCAGVYAWTWGLPVDGFVAVANKNIVFPEYLETGHFKPRKSLSSYANAMDVGNPSNFDRLESLFRRNAWTMQSRIRSLSVSDEQIVETMKEYYKQRGEFICPHSATSIYAMKHFESKDSVFIALATAHAAKFVEVVELACGNSPSTPIGIAESLAKPKVSTLISNNFAELADYLLGISTTRVPR